MAEHRCEEIERELKEFKEQYAQNGKEIMRLVLAIENIISQNEHHFLESQENKKKRIEREEAFKKELKPVLDSYNTLINGRKWVMGTIVFFFTIGSFYLLLKQIFHK